MDRSKNIIDKICSIIPGYRGYAERDGRRKCDKQLRNILSIKISEAENILIKKINMSITESNMGLVRELEACRKETNTTLSKIKFAPYGESPFFADEQIKENELMSIYQFDLEMAELVDVFLLESNMAGPNHLMGKLDELIVVLSKRNQYIKEHK